MPLSRALYSAHISKSARESSCNKLLAFSLDYWHWARVRPGGQLAHTHKPSAARGADNSPPYFSKKSPAAASKIAVPTCNVRQVVIPLLQMDVVRLSLSLSLSPHHSRGIIICGSCCMNDGKHPFFLAAALRAHPSCERERGWWSRGLHESALYSAMLIRLFYLRSRIGYFLLRRLIIGGIQCIRGSICVSPW